MATYKVLQDIEAEDKLIGPLTLWQFIYALGAALCGYLSAIAIAKNVPLFLILLVPVTLVTLFLAIPWKSDQPVELWALAKLRFYLKPRKRIWSQDGMTDLVTVTAPKRVERVLTDGLSQHEVHSRLSALANTLDSRGWVVKNVNVNLFAATTTPNYTPSDRLVDVSGEPQEVSNIDIRADDDILDETANPVAQNFSALIDTAAAEYRKTLLARMQGTATNEQVTAPIPTTAQQTSAAAPQWFVPNAAEAQSAAPMPIAPGGAAAAEPTDAEESIIAEVMRQNAEDRATTQSHLKMIKTPEQIAEEQKLAAERAATEAAMTAERQAAIMNLAQKDDWNIATVQRQADTMNEVVIPLR